jgi:hypothetical protein
VDQLKGGSRGQGGGAGEVVAAGGFESLQDQGRSEALAAGQEAVLYALHEARGGGGVAVGEGAQVILDFLPVALEEVEGVGFEDVEGRGHGL